MPVLSVLNPDPNYVDPDQGKLKLTAKEEM
jgi:hypothetical protein